MATYIQCKAGAFRKIEDIAIPLQKDRSECRLKRYASVTDTRVWMNNARENKAFIIQLMGEEPSLQKRKIMGQIVPVDMIWKILLSHKNNYICELEERIQTFVELLQKINLSKQQITKVRHLCATTFRSINDYLIKYKLTERQQTNDIEKSIQVCPRMLNTIMEAKVLTNNVEIRTLSTEMCDNTTFTRVKSYIDQGMETIPLSLSDVSLQVLLPPRPMSDKSVAVRVRSTSSLVKKTSLRDQTTEISLRGTNSLGVGSMRHIPEMMNKSVSDTICKKDVSCSSSEKITFLRNQATEVSLGRLKSLGVGDESVSVGSKKSLAVGTLNDIPEMVCKSQSDTVCKQDASCDAISVSSSAMLDKKMSLKEQTTEMSLMAKQSLGTGDISVEYPSCGVGSGPEMVDKSQSDIVCKRDASGDALRSRARRSSVSFATRTESIPLCNRRQSKQAKAFDSSDTINPLEIINDLVGISPSESSGETIEVISECEQTSFCELKSLVRPSVIQLYCSHRKSSVESTYMQHGSDHALDDDSPEPKTAELLMEEVGTQRSSVDIAVGPGGSSNQDQSNESNELIKYCLNKCIDCISEEHDSDDDDFHDCKPPSEDEPGRKDQETNIVSCLKRRHLFDRVDKLDNLDKPDDLQQKDQETNVVSCLGRKQASSNTDNDCCARLKIAEAELAKHKSLASCAMEQLFLVRQTLQENDVTIAEIDLDKISDILNSSNYHDIINLEGCLVEACGYNVEPYVILNEQFQLIEALCNAIKISETDTPFASATSLNAASASSQTINTPSSIEARKQVKELEFYKNKCVALEQTNLERDKLLETVNILESDLKTYDSMKFEFASDPNVVAMLDANDIVREIRALKARAELSEHLEQKLAFEKCTVGTLKESLSHLSAQRFAEYETMRHRAREADIIQLELDRLRIQFTDVQKLKADNLNLQNKCTELKRAQMKRSSPSSVEQYLQFSKEQSTEIEELKKEKQALLCTVVIKECEIVEQEDQIERLVMHVDRLTTTNEEQQERAKQIVKQLRTDLTSKEDYIAKLDGNLEWVEEKLKQSITTISKDSNQWQNKLTQMEQTCIHYKVKNDSMQDTINVLRKQLEREEELNKTYSMELQQKSKLLEEIDSGNSCKEIAQKMKSVNKMECILKKSHNAVRKVVEELAKQYRCDLTSLHEIVPELMVNNA